MFDVGHAELDARIDLRAGRRDIHFLSRIAGHAQAGGYAVVDFGEAQLVQVEGPHRGGIVRRRGGAHHQLRHALAPRCLPRSSKCRDPGMYSVYSMVWPSGSFMVISRLPAPALRTSETASPRLTYSACSASRLLRFVADVHQPDGLRTGRVRGYSSMN